MVKTRFAFCVQAQSIKLDLLQKEEEGAEGSSTLPLPAGSVRSFKFDEVRLVDVCGGCSVLCLACLFVLLSR